MDALTRHRLAILGLDPEATARLGLSERVRAVNAAFVERVPVETLSEGRRRREFPADPDRWTRTTDRVLREVASDGLGGTCFALAYALAELLRGVGANARVTLGRRADREETHAAVIVFSDDVPPVLLDPSWFLSEGVPLWPDGQSRDTIGTFTLRARRGPLLSLERTRPGGKPKRLYSLIPFPAPPDVVLDEWKRAVSRRRDDCVRLARREGDVVKTFCEASGRLAVHGPQGTQVIEPGPDLPAALHAHFGVDLSLLRAHFAAAAPRSVA